MSQSNRAFLDSLPDEFIVYRGSSSEDEGIPRSKCQYWIAAPQS